MILTATDIETTIIFRSHDAVDTLNNLPLSFKLDKQKLIKCINKTDDRYLRKNRFDFFFFNKLLCVSSIPSLSTPMHWDTIYVMIDWQLLNNKLLCEI
ncbi:hypothetical protein IWX84_002659 [Flavobacterium sp. CG_9.10]|uniref:hypothetical protein n=1 Tax=Flavobacterium sp. CG_9.10 TaxID=2787729 RepID=UPI0018CA59F1|nr:hypothetical protein [Flavobacterium sp. CG_9.10]MBG6111771.1 hypothetical protein [Flavobacterium sp. CG_9.10]